MLVKMLAGQDEGVGVLTPPVGLNVYVVTGLFDDLEVDEVFRLVFPFVGLTWPWSGSCS